MGKPPIETFNKFKDKFYELSKKAGKKQYLVPYLMSSHPGSTLKDAVYLAEYLYKNHMRPEQVQDFYPTPGTVSTCMFYTGVDPRTMEPVYIPRDPHEKAMQRALIQYRKPENYKLVKEALRKAGREDLIGYGSKCLIRPVPPKPGAGGGKKQVGSGAGKPANGTSKRATSRHEDAKPPRSPKIAPSAAPRHASGKKGANYAKRTDGRQAERAPQPRQARRTRHRKERRGNEPARPKPRRTGTPRREPALTARRYGGANQDIRRAESGGPRPRPPRAKCPVPPPHPAASQWNPAHRTSSRAVRTPLFPMRTSRRRTR